MSFSSETTLNDSDIRGKPPMNRETTMDDCDVRGEPRMNHETTNRKKTRSLSMYDSRGNILEPFEPRFSPSPQRRHLVKSRDFYAKQRGSTADLLYGDVTRINNLKVRYPIFDR